MRYVLLFLFFVGIALPGTPRCQWQLLTGPYCSGTVGFVTTLGPELYTAAPSPSVSTDGGQHWRTLCYAAGTHGIIRFADTMILATETGVFRSTDNGVKWLASSSGISGSPAIFCMLPTDSGLLVGSYSTGVFRSTDRGKSWTASSTGLTSLSLRALSKVGNWTLAATANGVFRSSDNGSSWTRSDSGLSFKQTSSLAVDDSLVIVGTYGGGVFRSTDAGRTWSKGTDSLPSSNIEAVATCSGIWFACTTGGIRVSLDSGRTWKMLAGTQTMYAQTIAGSHDTLYVGTFGGLYRCIPPAYHWVPCGVTTPQENWLRSNGARLFVTGASGGVLSTAGNGDDWQPESPGLTYGAAGVMLPLDSSLLVGMKGGVFVIRRGTDTLVNTDTMLTNYNVNDLVRSDSFIFAATHQNGVFRSSDGGVSWDGPSDDMAFSNVRFMAALGSTVFAVRQDSGIYRSTDQGLHWIRLAVNDYDRYPTALVVADSVLIASYYSSAIRRSTDLGASWQIVTLPATSSITKLTALQSHVFAATYSNVILYSSDAGVTWSVSDSFTKTINATAIFGDNLYLATNTGVWKRPLGELGTAVPDRPVLSSVALYPNPTEGPLCISGLPTDSYRITISDELGRAILTKYMPGGDTVSMMTDPLPTGTYIVHIESAGTTINRILQKR